MPSISGIKPKTCRSQQIGFESFSKAAFNPISKNVSYLTFIVWTVLRVVKQLEHFQLHPERTFGTSNLILFLRYLIAFCLLNRPEPLILESVLLRLMSSHLGEITALPLAQVYTHSLVLSDVRTELNKV